MLLFSILCFLIFDFSFSQTVSDLCDKQQFSPFTFPSNRSVDYNKTTTLNDRFMREGWYGTLDFIIPSEQPESRHCGAQYVMFLQSEPGVERVIVDVTVCIRDCGITMTMKALKCSERLTVYNLLRPSGNGAAYCLDAIKNDLLNFTTTVTVTNELRLVPDNDYEQEFNFNCLFPDPDIDSLLFKATWFVDNVVVYESPYTEYDDTNETRILTDTRLRNSNITTVGFQLHCDIRATINSRSSLPSTSKKTFIGIKVLTPVITIKEGNTALIRIRPTVPIGCTEPDGCSLTVAAEIPRVKGSQCEPTATATGGCGISFSTSQWNRWHRLDITSTVTEEYGQSFTQKKVFLRTDITYFSQPIWQNYFLEPVTINIVKDTSLIEQRYCSFYNDPYLWDFNARQKESFQLAGTFYLLKLDNIEVQVQVTDCSGRQTGYCVCGAVVRVGRTAFMINRCNLGYWFIDYILCDDGGDILDVKKSYETVFEIILPSGTKLKIDINKRSDHDWLNIQITPSVRDINKTSGLCGELTDDRPASVQHDNTYFNFWRVKNDKNLFVPDNWKNQPEWNAVDTRFQHCLCDEILDNAIDTTLNCTVIPGATTCSSETDYTLFHKKRCISPARKKRSLPRLTQPQAIHYQRLKRLSGTKAFSLSAISSVSSQCVYEARMNRTLRDEKVENGKTILELVKEVDCPGQCSDQGICEDGNCICNSGYIGSDCSVPINKPPLAHGLEADGYCDISEEDCNDVAVFGGRFVDDDQTTCKMFSFEINNNQVTVSKKTEIKTAIFETIGEVTCQLPSKRRSVDVPVIDETVTGYKVSVSNNGQNYSEQLTMIIYNTECMNCNRSNSEDIMCSFSSNYCIMDARCYRNGAIYDTGEREFMCRADNNGKEWLLLKNGTVIDATENPSTTETSGTETGEVTKKTPTTEEQTDYVIIGISVTVAVVFIIVCLVIFILVCKKKGSSSARNKTLSSTSNPTYDNSYDSVCN